MTCKRCRSNDIQRSRRKGSTDRLRAVAGWWPYRCESCGLRFHARGRHIAQAPQEPRYGHAEAETGPAMAFRADAVKPQAKVVIAADSHEQLNHILLALDRAISSYQRQSQAGRQAESAYNAEQTQ